MKKLIRFIVALIVSVSLVGCSNSAAKDIPTNIKASTEAAKPKKQSTPELEQKLFDAIKFKQGKEAIKKALDDGADINAIDPKSKITALMIAAAHGNIEAIDLLLENGADINKLTEKGDNVLFYCLQKEEILKHLISKGADPNVKSKDGRTYKDSAKKPN